VAAARVHKADLLHENVSPQSGEGVHPGHRIGVEIRSPDGPIWSGWAQSLRVPESLGLMGILPGHAPLVAALDPGLTLVRQEGGPEVRLITGAGFLEIAHNRVLMLVDSGEDPTKVDVKRAQAARDRALGRLRSAGPDIDHVRAEAALQRALVRLRSGPERGE
jgi:F-type H+-transporting ATPase subunit epsilon